MSQIYRQRIRSRKKGCNEDCLQRIASRLCQLDASCADGECSAEKNDNCAAARSKLPVETGDDCPDACCKPQVGEKDDEKPVDTCCKPSAGDKEENSRATGSKLSIETSDNCADACCGPVVSKRDEDCADACCKPSVSKEDNCTAASSKLSIEGSDDCADACCEPASSKKDDDCADACCKSSASKNEDNCTADRSKLPTETSDGCGDVCCKRPISKEDDNCANDCCKSSIEGKDDYAETRIECTNDCCDSSSQKSSMELPSTCSKHLQAAFARFEALIRQGQCLCRRLMTEMNFCCCAGEGVSCGAHTNDTIQVSTQSKECKTELFSQTAKAGTARDRDASKPPQAAAVKSSSEDAERAAAREQVVLNVDGMTCTGCSRKLMNVMDGISGISNPKVTFVSGTATFELEHRDQTMGLDDVLSLIERQTGFKLSRVISGYQHVDVLMNSSVAQQLERESPDGLVNVEKISGKEHYRITYNPTIVGVRDLLPSSYKLAPPAPDPSLTAGKKRLVTMTFLFALSAIFTIPIVVLSWANTPVPRQTREIISLVLATFVQAVAVPEFYIGAVKSLVFSRIIEMDMLVVISITAAYFYSVVAFALYEVGITVEEAAFFETSSLLITLVLLGRLVAAFARLRAVSAVSLRSLQAETTQVLQTSGQMVELDARLLQFGDTFQIPAHTRIVTDGNIVSGASAVDESMLTGESNPVPKQTGDTVIAGTVNGPSVLVARLTRLPGANSITDIANLVENALGAKPRIQDLADKVASWFIPAVVAISIITFIIWIVVALKIRGENAGGAIGTAITYGIAVLAISCPCALGLAVPMVLVIAGGVAARSGVVIKEADALERGYKTTDVVFDKTGTLTKADLTVAHVSSSPTQNVTEEEAFALTSTLVAGNSHPVSLAISLHLKEHKNLQLPPTDVVSVPGAGIEASWKSLSVKAGNPYWTSTNTEPAVRSIIEAGMTAFCVTIDGSLVLSFGLTSTIRDEAVSVIQTLQRRNVACHVVSGDTTESVRNIASRVGIDAGNVAARHSPAQKMEYIKRLQSEGRVVLFCGDGTNDAVAVAQANVGVQIGAASDVTNGVCDVTLLGGLEGVITLLGISKRAFARITFNFAWTAIYNVFAILLASGAFVVFRIPPAYAGLGEIVSVCPVIAAAVTLVWGKNSL